VAKKRCRKKGRRRCITAFNFNDPLSYKLYAFFAFDGRTCQEILRAATCGVHQQTAVNESIAGYFQPWKFGPKFNGGFGTFYSVSLPDNGWFTFNNALIGDSNLRGDLTGKITLVWRGSLRDDGNTLTELQIIGKHAGNGATNNPFDFNTSHGGTPTPRVTRATAGSFVIHQAPAALSFDTNYTIAVFQDGADISQAATYFKDGASWGTASTSGGGSGQCTGGAADVRIGRRADNALQFRGRNERILIYTRALSAQEHWQIHDDPDVVFQEDDYATSISIVSASLPVSVSSSVRFGTSFVRADAFFNAGARFVSSFKVVESRGSFNSSVNFTSKFVPCIASDIYGYDAGDSGRYRR